MKKQLYFIVLLLATNSNLLAQTNNTNEAPSKNGIYINGSTFLFYNTITLNYDRHLWGPKKGFLKNYYVNAGVGAFSFFEGFTANANSGVIGSVGLTGLTGKNKNHFEIGLGTSLNIETKFDPERDDGTDTFLLPDLRIGYRYQEKNGFIFRVGLGIPQGIYLSLGARF